MLGWILDVSEGWHGPQREWIQRIGYSVLLMRVQSMTFSMLGSHGKGWWNYKKAAFFVITETQFAIQGQVT